MTNVKQTKIKTYISKLIVFGSVSVHYVDLITTIFVAVQWYRSGDYGWAIFFTILVILAPFILGIIIPVHKDTCKVAFLNFTFLAPLYAGYYSFKVGDIKAQPPIGHTLITTKFVTAIVASFPAGCLQGYVLTQRLNNWEWSTQINLQVVSLVLSATSVISHVFGGRIGVMRSLPPEFKTERWWIYIVLLIATTAEICSKLIGASLFLTAFRVWYFLFLAIQFILLALFYALVVDEEGLNRVFPAISGGFFNVLVIAPGPWVGTPFHSVGSNHVRQRGVAVLSKRAVWIILLIYFLCCHLFLVLFPTLLDSSMKQKYSNVVKWASICSNSDDNTCFPKWLFIFGLVSIGASVFFLMIWVLELRQSKSDNVFLPQVVPSNNFTTRTSRSTTMVSQSPRVQVVNFNNTNKPQDPYPVYPGQTSQIGIEDP